MTNFTVTFTPPEELPITITDFQIEDESFTIEVSPPENPPIDELTVSLNIGEPGPAGQSAIPIDLPDLTAIYRSAGL